MKTRQRAAYRYTPYFCEENVWWLAQSLIDEGMAPAQLEVLLFASPGAGVLLRQQRLAPPGELLQWDYHVVLLCRGGDGDGDWIFDFDSRLPFPSVAGDYLRETFPDQAGLPATLRTRVRRIPAAAYLRRFWSDRKHMVGLRAQSEFPDYPPLGPADPALRIALQDYRDTARALDDGSVVCLLTECGLA
jgi:hypothetical protein